MWGTSRGLLCLGLSLSALLCQVAHAEPWTVAADPDPQATATFVPAVFSEIAADGYWASGLVEQGQRALQTPALVRFDADGREQARAFSDLGFGYLLKRLTDGGVLSAVSGTADAPLPLGASLCQIVRLDRDGQKRWQTVIDGGACKGLDIDAAGEIWVATATDRITQVLRLRDDGTVATRIALDDPSQTLVEMRVDPAGAGVFLAGHAINPNTRAARARIQRLRADGSVDWLWQSSSSAMASSIKFLQVSASAGIFAIGGRFVGGRPSSLEKDWLAAGLSLGGVPRFEKTIRFKDAVDVVGASAPDAAGLWLVAQWGNRSDGANGGKVAVARLSASGKLGSSEKIKDAQVCLCQLALRRDGGLWLLLFDQTSRVVGVDAKGKERARLAVFSQSALGLLPDDRALGVTGNAGNLGSVSAVRIGFNQPAAPWPQVTVPVRTLAPIEAVASDGGVVQWFELPGANGNSLTSALTFRTGDTAPVAWRIEFPFFGDVQLSVSTSMVCLAGNLRDRAGAHGVVECRRRTDGSLLWQDPRPPVLSQTLDAFQAIAALEDGRAVAISSARGRLVRWVIGGDGQILSEQSQPLLGAAQQELEITRATINAQGDTLLAGFDRTKHDGILLRLDRDGHERFRTAFEGVFITYGDITQDRLAFAGDGGAIMYGSVITRYSASGGKLWELMPDRPMADLIVDGGTVMFSMRSVDGLFSLHPGEWELLALDSTSGAERWRLPLDAPRRGAVGMSLLTPQRLAVLQTEHNHLRYRELDVASGSLLREQTDVCGGELCGCEQNTCVPRRFAGALDSGPALPLQSAGGRLRARLSDFQAGTGWGSSVLELADAGQDQPSVRADQDGISGTWYAPWLGGQWVALEWRADSRSLFAPWLTFSPDGSNDPSGLRWYALQGVLADSSADAAVDILSYEGGRFGVNVGATTPRRVGSAHLSFESCDRAHLRYRFDPDENDGLSGVITLSRLTPATACDGGSVGATPPATPHSSDARITGAWFEPGSDDQGLVFDAIPAQDPAEDIVFATWFTYDTEAAPDDPRQQHWFTLEGPLGTGEQATLAIMRTIGGALGRLPAFNSQQVGTATVTRLACDRLRLDYRFDDSESAGPFRRIRDFRELQRIGGCAD